MLMLVLVLVLVLAVLVVNGRGSNARVDSNWLYLARAMTAHACTRDHDHRSVGSVIHLQYSMVAAAPDGLGDLHDPNSIFHFQSGVRQPATHHLFDLASPPRAAGPRGQGSGSGPVRLRLGHLPSVHRAFPDQLSHSCTPPASHLPSSWRGHIWRPARQPKCARFEETSVTGFNA